MPYATPADPSSSSSFTATATRPGHRRTRSSFSDERGPGAFVSLGTLPRRRPSTAGSSAPTTPKKAVFHLNVDDESPQEDPSSPLPSADAPAATNSLRLSIDTHARTPPARIELPRHDPARVPFPSAGSPLLSPGAYESPFMPSPPSSAPGSLPRTPSTPIILSNGKPLKSSLKSSSSSPNVAGDFSAVNGARMRHLRAQSAPSTPRVHFAEKDAGLETVKLFHRTGKPASLSKPPGDETETETEAESYPFPSVLSSSSSSSTSLTSSTPIIHEIDPSAGRTSPVPNPAPSPLANVHLETVTLPRTRPPTLRGTVLVRNLAFEKNVAVRFTLDDWQTTSEVACRHVVSLPGLPPPFPKHARRAEAEAVAAGKAARGARVKDTELEDDGLDGRPTWDRFSFTIRLEDYESKLSERTLFLVARFNPGGGGEFWDNNGGANYRIAFRRAAPSPLGSPARPPFTTASAYDVQSLVPGLNLGLGLSTNLALPNFSNYAIPQSQSQSQAQSQSQQMGTMSQSPPQANGSLDRLLRNVEGGGMGVGMGMGTGTHAQQRTFSAPSSLRYTPPTAAVPAVVSRVAVGGTGAAAHAHAHWRGERDLVVTEPEPSTSSSAPMAIAGQGSGGKAEEGEGEGEAEKTPIERAVDREALRYAAPLLRRHSSPHPARRERDEPHFPMPPPIAIPHASKGPASAPGTMGTGTGKAAGAYIARRLSLSNYVAPGMKSAGAGGSGDKEKGAEKGDKEGRGKGKGREETGMATPPTTPPREEKALPSSDSENERRERRRERDVRLSPLVMIGGMPASTPETLALPASKALSPLPSLSPSPSPSRSPARSPLHSPRRSPSPQTQASGSGSGTSSASSSYSSASSGLALPPLTHSRTPSGSDTDSTPTPTLPPARVPQAVGIERTPSETLDADEDKAPFSPTGRRAPAFPLANLGGGLVSPPESEDGSARSSPAGTGRSSPTNANAYMPMNANGGEFDPSADSSYAALVRQWCFAQSAPPTPGVITPSEGDAVRVGGVPKVGGVGGGGSPVPTPSPPITASMAMGSFVNGINGMGVGGLMGMGVSGGMSGGAGPTPRRQQAWPVEHQYGFPGFGFGGAGVGRGMQMQMPRSGAVAEGVVGGECLFRLVSQRCASGLREGGGDVPMYAVVHSCAPCRSFPLPLPPSFSSPLFGDRVWGTV
ncbi:hypothetical protein EIP86_010451 [Pleurotus ostreatoroseus]|nr:hypothetical protein EIP86_010451 [Pleurotus ostreatoroseus]